MAYRQTCHDRQKQHTAFSFVNAVNIVQSGRPGIIDRWHPTTAPKYLREEKTNTLENIEIKFDGKKDIDTLTR